MKNTAIKIPLLHILFLVIFIIVVNLVISNATQGHSELYGIIYSLGFFLGNSVYSVVLGVLLFAPLPLLIIAIIKKRQDLIQGFAIAFIISLAVIATAYILN